MIKQYFEKRQTIKDFLKKEALYIYRSNKERIDSLKQYDPSLSYTIDLFLITRDLNCSFAYCSFTRSSHPKYQKLFIEFYVQKYNISFCTTLKDLLAKENESN